MKISFESPSKIVLKNDGYRVLVFGLALLAFGCILVFLFLNNIQLGVITSDNKPIASGNELFGAIAIVIGIGILATSHIVTITLDKLSGKCDVSQRGIFYNKIRQTDLGMIKKIFVRKDFQQNYTRGRRGSYDPMHDYTTGYTLVLSLDAGNEMVFRLGSSKTVVQENDVDMETKTLGQKIADFLGVPLDFPKSPP